ncbi:MAG: glycosyltransferase family 4 protein, partial [Chitinophagaceae bacterium]|nr:glycosyltransferase family 4 protein [Chitinophagaceae bacterium]
QVIRHLLGQGYSITVVAPDDGYSGKLVAEGCSYEAIDFNNRSENPINDYFLYRRLRKLYRKIDPDFIFHYVAKPNIYGSLAAGAENIPSVAVVTGLGYPFAKRNWLFRIIKFLYKKALKKTWEVWFLNNEDAKVFVTEKIVEINKMKVLPGEGVNTEHFKNNRIEGVTGNNNRAFNFLMSTRLLKSKGVSLYADAARILKKKNYNVHFNLIGFFEDGHPDSIAKTDLDHWNREGLVSYSGFADDVRPFLSKADCFVFPSFYNEGVPRCLMEAASMELPIITSLNRGCKEVVLNNSNGFICNPNDAFDLADKMEKMINLSAEERSRMGRNGRQLVLKKFDVSKIIAEYTNTLISPFDNKHGSNS